jgi:hypothetical protein
VGVWHVVAAEVGFEVDIVAIVEVGRGMVVVGRMKGAFAVRIVIDWVVERCIEVSADMAVCIEVVGMDPREVLLD